MTRDKIQAQLDFRSNQENRESLEASKRLRNRDPISIKPFKPHSATSDTGERAQPVCCYKMTSQRRKNAIHKRATCCCCCCCYSLVAATVAASSRTNPLFKFILLVISLAYLHTLAQSNEDLRTSSSISSQPHPDNSITTSQYKQHNNDLVFHIRENKPINSLVGNIRSSDGQIPFTVVPRGQTSDHDLTAAFVFNDTTGDITTKMHLDREYREHYYFTAITSQPHYDIKGLIIVDDVNDNAPMFLTPPNESNFVIDMPEGQKGIRKPLPLAFDYDVRPFNIIEFTIVSGNTPNGLFKLVEHDMTPDTRSSLQNNFASQDDAALLPLLAEDSPLLMQHSTSLIPSQTGSLSQASLDLWLVQPLDRENQSSYQLTIEAIDGGQPPLIGRLMVTVNVQDINDNDPVFVRKLYETQVREDTAKGLLLLRVQAHDADIEANAQISYFIKRHSSSSQQTIPASSFINSLTTNSSDNFEMNSTRQAYTNAKQQQHRQTTSPTASLLTSASATQQNKFQRAGHEIVLDAASSIDSNNLRARSSSVQLPSAESQHLDQMFGIDPIKGEIYLNRELDFETDQVHELIVEARDHGRPARSGYTTVKIMVLDVPDEPQHTNKLSDDRRHLTQSPEALRNESASQNQNNKDSIEGPQSNYSTVMPYHLPNWFTQVNSSNMFVIILTAILVVALFVCLVKIKSRQLDSDYNDTAGLTMASNNGQAKQSPNHSTSNEHSSSSNENHHHRYDHQRRSNNSFGALSGSGYVNSPGGKLRYQYHDSSNLYHNPYTAPSQQSQHQHHTSTSPLPETPNTTHSSGLPMNLHDAAAIAAAAHHAGHPHGHNSLLQAPLHRSGSTTVQQPQLPPTPCNAPASIFTWPQTPGGSLGEGCLAGLNGAGISASTAALHCGGSGHSLVMDSSPSSQPLDRWFDLGVPLQLIYAHDWCGSYNWDYLKDWSPKYNNLLSLLQSEDRGGNGSGTY